MSRTSVVNASGVHVLVPTHTARYLDVVLAGLARQTRRPDTLVVSCDTDDEAIGGVLRDWCGRTGLSAWWVRRAHHGGERLCQVRNNGVRRLLEAIGGAHGRLVIIDGDTLLREDCLEGHARLGAEPGTDLVYPYRVDIGESGSSAISAGALLRGHGMPAVSPEQRGVLERRHRRYLRQLLLRRLGLGPAHKPKLLGGHFSVTLATYVRLNGFDELYQGWGFKDDEFAYRAAKLGVPCTVAVRELIAFHLYHPTRQTPGRMSELPTARRFASRSRLPLVAEHGVRNPLAQNPVSATLIA